MKWGNTDTASSFLLLFFTELTRAKQANFSMQNTHSQQACANALHETRTNMHWPRFMRAALLFIALLTRLGLEGIMV